MDPIFAIEEEMKLKIMSGTIKRINCATIYFMVTTTFINELFATLPMRMPMMRATMSLARVEERSFFTISSTFFYSFGSANSIPIVFLKFFTKFV